MDTTRDTTSGITLGEVDHSGVSIELSGEFDTRALEPLREALDDALGSGPPGCVDLSGVTFLDVRCTRELASRCRLHDDRLSLLNPS